MQIKSQGVIGYAATAQVKMNTSKAVTQNASSSNTCNLHQAKMFYLQLHPIFNIIRNF